MIAIINKVASMGEAWYMQTFCYLTAPLACVMVCEGVYSGDEKVHAKCDESVDGGEK